MSWSVSNGVHVIGVPYTEGVVNYGPAPDPSSSSAVPPALVFRHHTPIGSTAPQLASWATYLTSVIANGHQPIPYCTAHANNFTDQNWTDFVQRWVDALIPAGVRIFEVGNEPDKTFAAEYWTRLKIASRIIRAAHPDAKVLLASHGPNWGAAVNNYTDPDPGDAAFLQAADGNQVFPYVDGVVIHPYATGPVQGNGSPAPASSCLAQVRGARQVLDNLGGYTAELPFYITEFGWGTAPDGNSRVGNGTLNQREAWQAQRLTEGFNLLTDPTNAVANKIRLVCWYTLRDLIPVSPDTWPQHCGTKNTNPTTGAATTNKPSWTNLVAEGLGAIDPFGSPVVTTDAGGTISGTTATVTGTIDPKSRATKYWVQFSSISGYNRVSTVQTVPGPLNQVKNVSVTLTGLSAGNWHYRLVASNEAGTGYGSDQTLTAIASTPDRDAGAGIATLSESEAISGLSPATAYQYRIVTSNVNGTTSGSWVPFTTNAVTPTVPTALTGAATNVSGTHATLNGIVNVKGITGGQWRFEWGTNTSYGNNTAWTAIAGSTDVFVSSIITGLTQNQLYHFRVVAQNANGTTNGADNQFGFTPPANEPPELFTPSLLPLDLSVEIETVDGRMFRWDAEDRNVTSRPSDIQFATQEGDGFADASVTLNRAIGLDWPDLGLLETGRFVGAQGFIAYEGRVTSTPRSVGDSGETFVVNFTGWMSSAKDRPFTEVYVDRSGDNWLPPSLGFRKALLGANLVVGADYTATVDSGSITFAGPKTPGTGGAHGISVGSQAPVVYNAPSGTRIASFGYEGTQANTGNCEGPILHGTDNDAVTIANNDTTLAAWPEHLTLTLDGNIRTPTFTNPRNYAMLRVEQSSGGSTPANPFQRHYEKIAVYGNHGLVLRQYNEGKDPPGVYASDVIKNIVDRFCPKLDASQITNTTLVIPHLAFSTPTVAFDAFTLLNGYHAFLLNAWENGVIQWEPADLTQPNWLVRKGEPGITMDLQGEATDQFANGIVVNYTDIDQRVRVLYPTDFPQLRDDDPDNQANKAGIKLWTTLDLSVTVDQRGALTLGSVALAEMNRPKWPGTITVSSGYIADINENPMPAYQVRCGQTLSIPNIPNDEPRLITATDYSEDGTLNITLEQPPPRLDALLARIEMGADLPFSQPSKRGGGGVMRSSHEHHHR